ncbi:MAG: peroxiredoxin [Pseudoruegeria sp.]
MTISVGDTLPGATLSVMGDEGPETVSLKEVTSGRKIAIFGLPGAYTGICSTAHVPSFMRARPALEAKGIDEVICISVNDPFVLQAWGDATGATEAGLTFLGDSNAAFTKEIGLDFSAPPVGLIDRSLRYSMVVDDGKVTILNVEENPGVCELSAGEALVDSL